MPKLPENGRVIAAVMLAGGVVLMILNHVVAGSRNVIFLIPVFLGPMVTLLGLGGVIEPKIVWSIGKYGEHLPVKYKLIGAALALTGIAISAFLAFVVYRLHDVPAARP